MILYVFHLNFLFFFLLGAGSAQSSWLDKDMQPGLTSISTYVPGKGLTLEYQGEERGTIANKEFIEMYYRYNFGEKADKKIRKGLLGN